MDFVGVAAGEFSMGWAAGHPAERPVHRVWVDAFEIATRPVSNAEWAAWLAATGAAPPPFWRTVGFDAPDQPVVGLSWDDAVVETFLSLLAAASDTHVARRSGAAVSAEVSQQARYALSAGGVRSEAGRHAIKEMDARLRDARYAANPGTAADLTAAALFVVLLGGGWAGIP